jgi:hypothetical protein
LHAHIESCCNDLKEHIDKYLGSSAKIETEPPNKLPASNMDKTQRMASAGEPLTGVQGQGFASAT